MLASQRTPQIHGVIAANLGITFHHHVAEETGPGRARKGGPARASRVMPAHQQASRPRSLAAFDRPHIACITQIGKQ
jgi:hypothetical protein